MSGILTVEDLVPTFSIASTPDDDELCQAAVICENQMRQPQSGPTSAGHRDPPGLVDQVWTFDPWSDGTTDQVQHRVPKSPRTSHGKGRWDVGPLATACHPPRGPAYGGASSSGVECAPTFPASTVPASIPDALTNAPVVYQDLQEAVQGVQPRASSSSCCGYVCYALRISAGWPQLDGEAHPSTSGPE